MTKEELKAYFGCTFQGMETLLEKLLSPIFGEFEAIKYPKHNDYEPQYGNGSANIEHIYDYGSYTIEGAPVSVWEVVLADNCHISRARKNVQEVVRRLMGNYSGAFVVFHYEKESTNADKDTWRLSWVKRLNKNSATTTAKRYTYLCGPGYSCRTIAERFKKLETEENKTLDTITDAFDAEALSEEFFSEYKVLYDDIVQWITGQRIVRDEGVWKIKGECGRCYDKTGIYLAFRELFDNNEDKATKAVRDYVKKLMGRLVFIQFLQKKGYLGINGRMTTNFLMDLFTGISEKKQDDFIETALEQVVYLLLNNEKREKSKELIDDLILNVPFLNGGLFEPDAFDKEIKVKLPKEFFHNKQYGDEKRVFGNTALRPADKMLTQCGILDLFNHYNFTIDENDPDDAEMGVDPEMLGKIFENLLEDNKEKGAFYTPKEVVQYMCKESLIAYLQTGIEDEETKDAIRQFVTTQEIGGNLPKDIDRKLQEVKICDPAIGSGAFPMGLLNLLVALREELEPSTNRCDLKKEIIQKNIYGVDIERGAIDIARLRFWLSIMVDEEVDANNPKPTPLPNFDYKFMQGNSLIECYGGIDLSMLDAMKLRRSNQIQRDLFGNIEGVEQGVLFVNDRYAKFDLSKELSRYFRITSHDEKDAARKAIEEYILSAVKNTLLVKQLEIQADIDKCSQKSGMTKKQERWLDKKKEEEKAIGDAINNLQSVINDQFFLWHTWFKDIFDDGGFDIVIGNPPYNGISQNNNESIRSLIEDYKKEPGTQNSLKERKLWLQDDYVKFIRKMEVFIEFSPRGILAFINNSSFIDNPTFRGMRWHLLNTFDSISILDLHGNTRKSNASELGKKDENVFNIMQGVSINIFQKEMLKTEKCLAEITHAEIIGTRKHKKEILNKGYSALSFQVISPMPPFYFFVPQNRVGVDVYDRGFEIQKLMPVCVTGIVTARDGLVIDIDYNCLLKKIEFFADKTKTDTEVRNYFFGKKKSSKYLPGDSRGWNLVTARQSIQKHNIKDNIIPFAFRVLDNRFVYYSPDMVDWGREEIYEKHVLNKNNYCLVVPRQTTKEWKHVFVTDKVANFNFLATGGQNGAGTHFPLYLYDSKGNRAPNINDEIRLEINRIIGYETSAEELFDYVYGILHSKNYRNSYMEFLKKDFPKIPYPKNASFYQRLSEIGGRLRKLHLFQELPPKDKNALFEGVGDNVISKVQFCDNKVFINNNQYFDNIPAEIWTFEIGDDQPAKRWLKERKGMKLESKDVEYYQHLIYILYKTENYMKLIDEISE